MFPRAELYKVFESGGQKQQIPHPKNIFEYSAVMVIKCCTKITLRLTQSLHFSLINFFFDISNISKYWNITLRVLNQSFTI